MHRGRSRNVTGVLLENVVGRGRSRRRCYDHGHEARLHNDNHVHCGCRWSLGFRMIALLRLQHQRISRRVTQALDRRGTTDHDPFYGRQGHAQLLSEQQENCRWHQHIYQQRILPRRQRLGSLNECQKECREVPDSAVSSVARSR